jgi:hypothetical protein
VVSVPAVIARFVRSQQIESFKDARNNAGGGECLRSRNFLLSECSSDVFIC